MKNLMTVGEVSAKTRLARQTIYQLSSEGRIPRIKLGGRLLFDEEEIETWLEQFHLPSSGNEQKAG
ncbi:MAG: helix-turn-helix transcriptional regulator [Rectinemataceae bacterium]